MAINDSDQFVGSFNVVVNGVQHEHGFLYTNGVFTTIDAPGAVDTFLTGINDAGEIVGIFTPAPEPASLLLAILAVVLFCPVIVRRHTSGKSQSRKSPKIIVRGHLI